MKKKLLLTLPIISILMLLLVSCNIGLEFENQLIGTWKSIDYQTDDWERIAFKENKSYQVSMYNAETSTISSQSGTYTYTDTTFSLRQYNSSNKYTFLYSITENQLSLVNGKTYIKQ